MRLANAKKGISLSFTFRTTKTSAREDEEYDFVLPSLVKNALEYLTKNNGVCTEGIFRVSGSISDIEQIAKNYEKGKPVPLDGITNVHTVAGLLKHYVRHRRGGLIPQSMHRCVLAAGNISDEEARIVCVTKTVKLLPANHKLILMRICEYLYEVQKNELVNLMNIYNLSLIFSSTLLPLETCDLEYAYAQTAYAHSFTETLIKHQERIFSNKEDCITATKSWEISTSEEIKAYDELLKQYTTAKDSPPCKKKKQKRTNSNNNNEIQKMAILNLTRKSSNSGLEQQTNAKDESKSENNREESKAENNREESKAENNREESKADNVGEESKVENVRAEIVREDSKENVYLDEVVAEKMCRREEVELLSQCLMLGEPELFMQHLDRIAKGDSRVKDTIQKAAIKMCRHTHRRKASV